jgi:hypothetical protein
VRRCCVAAWIDKQVVDEQHVAVGDGHCRGTRPARTPATCSAVQTAQHKHNVEDGAFMATSGSLADGSY